MTHKNVMLYHGDVNDFIKTIPIELAERCVLALTNEDDWVFDPYAGVGSALIATLKRKRKAVGCEKELDYISIAHDRFNAFFEGTLKVRQLGKPVFKPTGKEEIVQIPKEWQST